MASNRNVYIDSVHELIQGLGGERHLSGEDYTMVSEQSINVPLTVGSRVVLTENVDIDSQEGVAASILFEGYVEQYVPETNLLSFEENDTGYAEFQQLLEQADGVEIITNYNG